MAVAAAAVVVAVVIAAAVAVAMAVGRFHRIGVLAVGVVPGGAAVFVVPLETFFLRQRRQFVALILLVVAPAGHGFGRAGWRGLGQRPLFLAVVDTVSRGRRGAGVGRDGGFSATVGLAMGRGLDRRGAAFGAGDDLAQRVPDTVGSADQLIEQTFAVQLGGIDGVADIDLEAQRAVLGDVDVAEHREVQVGTSAGAAVAGFSDLFALMDLVADLDAGRVEMAVKGVVAVGVLDDDGQAVALDVAGALDDAVGGGGDSGAHRHRIVNARVAAGFLVHAGIVARPVAAGDLGVGGDRRLVAHRISWVWVLVTGEMVLADAASRGRRQLFFCLTCGWVVATRAAWKYRELDGLRAVLRLMHKSFPCQSCFDADHKSG